jgi:hypothetical protein
MGSEWRPADARCIRKLAVCHFNGGMMKEQSQEKIAMSGKSLFSLLIGLTILALVSLGCVFSTSSTTVSGYVEYDNKPIEGAVVTFGPTLGEATVSTGADGKFTVTAQHRPTAMLRLAVRKPRVGRENELVNREKIEFPAFWAPKEAIKVEMIAIL